MKCRVPFFFGICASWLYNLAILPSKWYHFTMASQVLPLYTAKKGNHLVNEIAKIMKSENFLEQVFVFNFWIVSCFEGANLVIDKC